MADEPQDQSHLDLKYFIDPYIYNCPYCNRRHVTYELRSTYTFNWTATKRCACYFVRCRSCENTSMHLSFEELREKDSRPGYAGHHLSHFRAGVDIDSKIFYSVPTSFFVMDERIPRVIRELITEAEGSLKMNFLTGASACTRKAIYELLVHERAEGDDYQERIKSLKGKHPGVDDTAYDVLAHIQDMTSDKVHEQSWPKWDAANLKLIIGTLRMVLHEIYVVPAERADRAKRILELRAKVTEKGSTPE